MTKEKLLNQEYQVQAEIPLAFMRYLETRTEERVLEVVLVYNGVDRFDTIIEPDGMRTDPSVVTVDYNHKGVNTGAYLRNVRVVDNYALENGTVLERALVGDIHIPKDSEMFYTTREGEKKSNGNLYEAVTKGQVRSVSVEFKPYLGKQITDTKTGITTFREWDLIRLSLLDVTPGQPYSGIKITRSLIQNNMQITLENIQTALEAGEITKESLRALVSEPESTQEEVKPTEAEPTTPEAQRSDSKIEIKVGESEGEGQGEETPPAPAEADANQDGEISDEEMRSYIKEVKRAFGDKPGMVNEKIDEAMRMCGDLKKRMDDMQTIKTETAESEAEMQRQHQTILNEIPEEAPAKVSGELKRQLDPTDQPKVENQKETGQINLTYSERVLLNQINHNTY